MHVRMRVQAICGNYRGHFVLVFERFHGKLRARNLRNNFMAGKCDVKGRTQTFDMLGHRWTQAYMRSGRQLTERSRKDDVKLFYCL